MAKRSRKRSSRPAPVEQAGHGFGPAAATIFRSNFLDFLSYSVLRKVAARARNRERFKADLEKVERAQSLEELVDLASLGSGVVGLAWLERVRASGPEALPLLAARLKQARQIEDEDAFTSAAENLIAALRWRGRPGGEALLEIFDDLDDYSKSLACTVLGILGVKEAADKIYAFYQQALAEPVENLFMGAVWGLVDLKDPRAADIVLELLMSLVSLYEIMPLISMAGDERCLLPLSMVAFMQVEQEDESGKEVEDQGPAMAMAGILHRVGKDTALEGYAGLFAEDEKSRESISTMLDSMLSISRGQVEDYFGVFYSGLGAQENLEESFEEEIPGFD